MKNSCKGFTLAEVLITLGVIGVVATITMPTLIQKHREQVTVNKLLKAYSTVSNAYQMAVQENGDINYWFTDGAGTGDNGEFSYNNSTYDNMNIFYNNLSRYLKTISVKEASTDNHTDIYSLDGTKVTHSIINTGEIKLADGTSVIGGYFSKTACDSNIACGDFAIDINSLQTPPNTIGKDIFYFNVFPNKIIPMGIYTRNNHDAYCNISINDNWNGYSCTNWIVQNKNMDYLHK